MTTSNLFKKIISQNKPPNKKKHGMFLKQILCFKFGFSSPQLPWCFSPLQRPGACHLGTWPEGFGLHLDALVREIDHFSKKKGKDFSRFFLRSILPFFLKGAKNVFKFWRGVFFSLPSIHFRGLSWKILNRCTFRNGTSLWNFREISGWWNKIWRDFVWTIW